MIGVFDVQRVFCLVGFFSLSWRGGMGDKGVVGAGRCGGVG